MPIIIAKFADAIKSSHPIYIGRAVMWYLRGTGLSRTYGSMPSQLSQMAHRGSPLGNPYNLNAVGGRQRCIELYREWLTAQLRSNPAVIAEFERIRELAQRETITLACWCAKAPRSPYASYEAHDACHGDCIGNGQTVTDRFTPPSLISKLIFTHSGSRNFIVKAYDDQGRAELLVNTIGRYSGIRPLTSGSPTFLEIEADGAWSVEVAAIGADLDAYALAGEGDYVSDLFDPPTAGAVPYALAHNGRRNFIVTLHCASGSDLVQNKIGPVEGQVVADMRKGPCFWEVRADGGWVIQPK